MLGLKLRKFLIYSGVSLIFLQSGMGYAQTASEGQETDSTSIIQEKMTELVLDDRQKAVQYAREGDFASAYTYIQRAYGEHPDNTKVFTDYIVILSWMEKYDEAVAAYDQHQEYDFPDYALEELIDRKSVV